ncbi:MAG TPA: hypothetical protein VF711_10170 [Acidimicrobiales bacterium]
MSDATKRSSRPRRPAGASGRGRPVISWYEAFLGGGPASVADLDVALGDLRGLPPIGGRLGRAVVLVAAGGREATTEQTVPALERLRASTGLHQHPARKARARSADRTTSTGARRTSPHPTRHQIQPHLPGMDRQ